MNLAIVAEAYNILIFTPDASDSSYNSSEGYSDWEAEVHKKIENYFLSHPVAMLFRHQVFSYAILVKGQRDTIKKNTCECVEAIQKIMEEMNKRGIEPAVRKQLKWKILFDRIFRRKKY